MDLPCEGTYLLITVCKFTVYDHHILSFEYIRLESCKKTTKIVLYPLEKFDKMLYNNNCNGR